MFKFLKPLFLIAILVEGLVVFSAVSYAQEDRRDLANRLNQIDNQIETLSQAVFRTGIIPQKTENDYKSQSLTVTDTTPADIEVRLSQLEREIRSLTGRVETVGHEVTRLEDILQRKISDIELRLQDLESQKQAMATQTPGTVAPAPSEPAPIPGIAARPTNQIQTLGTLPGGTDSLAATQLPIDVYETAFAKLKSGQYEDAEKTFRKFIADNPEHRLVSNARYWLGETYYVRQNFEQAARAFARGYKENPSGAKAPDNLLKLGLSLDGLGNRDDACVALIQLTQKFPDGPRPVLNRASQEVERLNCAR